MLCRVKVGDKGLNICGDTHGQCVAGLPLRSPALLSLSAALSLCLTSLSLSHPLPLPPSRSRRLLQFSTHLASARVAAA